MRCIEILIKRISILSASKQMPQLMFNYVFGKPQKSTLLSLRWERSPIEWKLIKLRQESSFRHWGKGTAYNDRTEQGHKAIICIAPKLADKERKLQRTNKEWSKKGGGGGFGVGRSCTPDRVVKRNERRIYLKHAHCAARTPCGPLSLRRPLSAAHSFVHSFIQLWPIAGTKAPWLLGHTQWAANFPALEYTSNKSISNSYANFWETYKVLRWKFCENFLSSHSSLNVSFLKMSGKLLGQKLCHIKRNFFSQCTPPPWTLTCLFAADCRHHPYIAIIHVVFFCWFVLLG